MANKLAGQRAKFSRFRAIYYTTIIDDQRRHAVRMMAEVLADAPLNGFSEDDVTQGEDVPQQVREIMPARQRVLAETDDSVATAIEGLDRSVDTTELREIGIGDQFVYAYGYRCASDRLKIGSAVGDVIARVAAQISTSTPDRPVLYLTIRTHDCRALERVLHGILRLRGLQIAGAGAEWFTVSIDQVIAAYDGIDALPIERVHVDTSPPSRSA